MLAAAGAAGVGRVVAQSIAFLYAPAGSRVVDEDAPPFIDAPSPFDDVVAAALELARQVSGAGGIALRYGYFYGPGTHYGADGHFAREVPRRRLPIVGSGEGVTSFVHVDDAAGATVAALERGRPGGVLNIVDDEPAAARDWLPAYAAALGAPAPRRVPKRLVQLVAGRAAAALTTEVPGASNARARAELGWAPRYPSWRTGFRDALRHGRAE